MSGQKRTNDCYSKRCLGDLIISWPCCFGPRSSELDYRSIVSVQTEVKGQLFRVRCRKGRDREREKEREISLPESFSNGTKSGTNVFTSNPDSVFRSSCHVDGPFTHLIWNFNKIYTSEWAWWVRWEKNWLGGFIPSLRRHIPSVLTLHTGR